VAYTMRPRPAQACAAAHIGHCSHDVYTVALMRCTGAMFATAHRTIPQLRMQCLVVVGDAVVVFVEGLALGADENCPERPCPLSSAVRASATQRRKCSRSTWLTTTDPKSTGGV